ncbi:cytochrome c-type biogenesis protein CcmH [Marinobacter halodurans]|uniref:Cytochrome c-type biogenesis protein n=1 Tax=Marinobacter halodurans TaxID=2528979 RepID=A0ABY1ZUD4_9GAMM|nr:cytochrome c-type biogenesis protein [Marinobacter halodurans]TBW59407.1 cytochrome c-type biogenesis protein CcmH [Marinobacter halodurans]
MRTIGLVLLILLSSVAHAAGDTYPFDNDADRNRFETLTRELRCPKCQNQSIADSHAPIAADMRAEVHRLVQQGESNDAIMAAMTSRFGEFVRYRPELERRTLLLWFTPLVVVVVGIAAVVILVIRSRRSARIGEPVLSEADRARLDRLLDADESPRDTSSHHS